MPCCRIAGTSTSHPLAPPFSSHLTHLRPLASSHPPSSQSFVFLVYPLPPIPSFPPFTRFFPIPSPPAANPAEFPHFRPRIATTTSLEPPLNDGFIPLVTSRQTHNRRAPPESFPQRRFVPVLPTSYTSGLLRSRFGTLNLIALSTTILFDSKRASHIRRSSNLHSHAVAACVDSINAGIQTA